jgi:hypothetical protein
MPGRGGRECAESLAGRAVCLGTGGTGGGPGRGACGAATAAAAAGGDAAAAAGPAPGGSGGGTARFLGTSGSPAAGAAAAGAGAGGSPAGAAACSSCGCSAWCGSTGRAPRFMMLKAPAGIFLRGDAIAASAPSAVGAVAVSTGAAAGAGATMGGGGPTRGPPRFMRLTAPAGSFRAAGCGGTAETGGCASCSCRGLCAPGSPSEEAPGNGGRPLPGSGGSADAAGCAGAGPWPGSGGSAEAGMPTASEAGCERQPISRHGFAERARAHLRHCGNGRWRWLGALSWRRRRSGLAGRGRADGRSHAHPGRRRACGRRHARRRAGWQGHAGRSGAVRCCVVVPRVMRARWRAGGRRASGRCAQVLAGGDTGRHAGGRRRPLCLRGLCVGTLIRAFDPLRAHGGVEQQWRLTCVVAPPPSSPQRRGTFPRAAPTAAPLPPSPCGSTILCRRMLLCRICARRARRWRPKGARARGTDRFASRCDHPLRPCSDSSLA